MKKVLFFTSARSDFGILSNILEHFSDDKDVHIGLVVTGSHLSSDYGDSQTEIQRKHFNSIFEVKIDNLGSKHLSKNINGLSKMLSEIGNIVYKENPNLFVLLGDRQEIFLAAFPVLLGNIPIIHIGGGDTTLGAIDNQIRHAVSNISKYHFVTNDIAKKMLIKMNISEDKIFLSGSPSKNIIEEINNSPPNKNTFLKELSIKNRGNILVCTFHPETKKLTTYEDLKITLRALKKLDPKKYSIIFTASNGDTGGKTFNDLIQKTALELDNFHFFHTLGIKRYLKLLSVSDIVVGNSSSGLHEAPSFKIPTIDIGGRQSGRERGESVFNVNANEEEILTKIKYLLSNKNSINFSNPYISSIDSSSFIYNKLKTILEIELNQK